MKRPLYCTNAAPGTRPPTAHTGLWFDKFCNQWRAPAGQSWSLKPEQGKNPKLAWIETVTTQTIGDGKLITEHATRLADLTRALGGQPLLLKTTSRLATGLGREHPIENGFVWHPVLGVPYLPGSSVKGLVRAWLEGGWCEHPLQPATFHRIFGSDYRKGSSQHDRERCLTNQSGSVLFLDALPTATVQLKPDVMTPHYGEYYQGKRDDNGNPTPPADWLSPNPIPFLTVAPGQLFQFALAPASLAARHDCEIASRWLADSLRELGAGAKTAVGYGRFTKPGGDALAGQPASPQEAPSRAGGPRYRVGQRVTVTRIQDPKGKGRLWFQADDGCGGGLLPGATIDLELGHTAELEVASFSAPNYNFRVPRPPAPQGRSPSTGSQRPRRS